MVANQEGVAILKLECPETHPVGRILREAPYQSVQYDPGAVVGPRRYWPDEGDQPQFSTRCRFCDKPVGAATATLQNTLGVLLDDAAQTVGTITLPYLN